MDDFISKVVDKGKEGAAVLVNKDHFSWASIVEGMKTFFLWVHFTVVRGAVK